MCNPLHKYIQEVKAKGIHLLLYSITLRTFQLHSVPQIIQGTESKRVCYDMLFDST